MPLHPDMPPLRTSLHRACLRDRHGIPSFCAMSDAHAVTPRLLPLRTSLHRACLRDRHGIPSFCAMSHAHAVTPRILQLRASLHRACLRDWHGIPSFSAMSLAHAVTPRLPQLRASLHRACLRRPARDCQLLCYERCTCRYTQKSSTSSIPSRCMSARPDVPFCLPRVYELLCYARRNRLRSSSAPVAGRPQSGEGIGDGDGGECW